MPMFDVIIVGLIIVSAVIGLTGLVKEVTSLGAWVRRSRGCHVFWAGVGINVS